MLVYNRHMLSARRICFALFLLIYSVLFLRLQPDYGITWDSALGEFYIGDSLLHFWRGGGLDLQHTNLPAYESPAQPDYGRFSIWAQMHPEHVWPLGPTLSALSREIFFTRLAVFDSIDSQHLFLLPLMLLLFASVYLFTARFFSPIAAAFSVLALALYPRLLADAHGNIKDVTHLVFWTVSALTVPEAIRLQSGKRLTIAGIFWGLALLSKANAVFLPLIVIAWALTLPGSGSSTIRPKRFLLIYGSLAVIVGLAVSLLGNPFFLTRGLAFFSAQFEYLSRIGRNGSSDFQILPAVYAVVATPLAVLCLAVLGLFTTLKPRTGDTARLRIPLFLLLLFSLPVFRVSLPLANDFDGIRHWLEFLPPLCIFAGVGFEQIAGRYFRTPALTMLLGAALLLPTLVWNVREHPFQISYFSSLVGGLEGARELNIPQAGDYWGSSYRRAIQALNREAEPNARLIVGVAQHILEVTASTELRPDIKLLPLSALPTELENTGPPLYLLYIVRPEKYSELLRELDANTEPAWTLRVENAAILKALRFP